MFAERKRDSKAEQEKTNHAPKDDGDGGEADECGADYHN